MNLRGYEASSNTVKFYESIVSRRKKITMNILALNSKKEVLGRRSTIINYNQFYPWASKLTIGSTKNEKHKTLPKLSTSSSKKEELDKLPSKNIYQGLSTPRINLDVTTKNWCLFDTQRGDYLGFRQENKREIASLTKIMTTYLAISFMQKYNLPSSNLPSTQPLLSESQNMQLR